MPRPVRHSSKLRLQRLRPRTLFSWGSLQRDDLATTLGGAPRRFDLALRLVLSQASLCLLGPLALFPTRATVTRRNSTSFRVAVPPRHPWTRTGTQSRDAGRGAGPLMVQEQQDLLHTLTLLLPVPPRAAGPRPAATPAPEASAASQLHRGSGPRTRRGAPRGTRRRTGGAGRQ